METIEITEVKRDERTPALIAALVSVWNASVRASHDFLTADDIRRLTPCVSEGLAAITTLLVARRGGAPVGFMGIDGRKIEMLFLAPAQFGQGLGRRLVTLAFDTYGVTHVDVNEQNARAAAFYRRMGFRPFAATPSTTKATPSPSSAWSATPDAARRAKPPKPNVGAPLVTLVPNRRPAQCTAGCAA